MLKFNELVEGVEYNRYSSYGTSFTMRYKLKDGLLYMLMHDEWVLSESQYNHLMNAIFEECEWMPKRDQLYYYPYFDNNLYSNDHWKDDCFDLAIKRNVGIYRTSEEAIAKAKELGWT
jgi:CRISPR/Cas system-associated protein Cas10 (large subunit of type III CRISPR-Cas system)